MKQIFNGKKVTAPMMWRIRMKPNSIQKQETKKIPVLHIQKPLGNTLTSLDLMIPSELLKKLGTAMQI